ncbi:MAG: hypothetical protein PHV59_03240 [Victivallales bacterium]|nr:hypothetical protein [Victivallales bacterium]
MVRFRGPIIYGLILFTLAAAVLPFYRSCRKETPEQVIRNRLADFLNKASKSPGDKLSTGLLKSQALKKFFAPQCSFQIGVSSFSGKYTPEHIYGNSMRCRSLFERVKFTADDVSITFISPSRARADFTGTLSGVTKSGKSIEDYRDLSCIIKLIEGEWLISEVSVREIIKK